MKIGLGTVQFGLDYGVANSEGQTSTAEAARILKVAERFGVRIVDTAALYGSSETVLGVCIEGSGSFDVVTKTPTFENSEITRDDADELEQTFLNSLRKLRRATVYGLLVHRVEDLLKPGGQQLMDRMIALKKRGLVKRIGVSVYSAKQIEDVLNLCKIDLIQVPLNVFDQRLLQSGHLKLLKGAGVEIHARSIFLQGLLLMNPGNVPIHLEMARSHVKRFVQLAEQFNMSAMAAALGFVMCVAEVDAVICGVNSHLQFQELCESAQTRVDCRDFAALAIDDENIVNPAKWRRA